jgi:hypothetical protein
MPFPVLARAAAVLLSRLLPAALASEARPLFAFLPLAAVLATILQSVPPGAGLRARQRRLSGTLASW